MDQGMGTSASPPRREKSARRLVQATASALRDLVLASEPDANIGSLPSLAQQLGVGVVTLQQAARILEHEGLLEVRRGPGGGYHGKRPDDAALERSMAAYMRVHGTAYHDVVEAVMLFEVEMVAAAAAQWEGEAKAAALRALARKIDSCTTPAARVAFEAELYGVLFRIGERPLIEMLARVTSRLQSAHAETPLFGGEAGFAAWASGRRRILGAVIQKDEELARFEAMRYRREVVERLKAARAAEASAPA
jgi:DNA-binding FadR family transcriptional regulator